MKVTAILSLAVLTLAVTQTASAQDAQTIIDTHCKACHLAGVGGAPKLDDKAAWAPRLATGADAMLGTVMTGKGAMPKQGTCMTCTEDELRAAIELLTQGVR